MPQCTDYAVVYGRTVYSTYSCLGVLRALRKSLQLSESEMQSKLKLVVYKLVVYKLEIRIINIC